MRLYACSVTLRNPIIACATRKRSITCASVALRNITAVAVPERRSVERSSPTASKSVPARKGSWTPRTTIVNDAVLTHRSGGRTEYEPIRAASAVASLRTKEETSTYCIRSASSSYYASNTVSFFHDLRPGDDRPCVIAHTATATLFLY